jgi:hypothetical protein
VIVKSPKVPFFAVVVLVALLHPVAARATAVGDAVDDPLGFPIEADGSPVDLRPSRDGEIEVLAPGIDHPVSTVAPAWATDAEGRPVPTHFEVRGSALVQVVNHRGASYPVVADPKHTWGYVTGTTYYSRKETRSLKTRTAVYTAVSAICAAFGTQTGGAACVAAGVVAYQWNYVAGNAYSDGKCVKIKVPTMWAYAYAGGYCK